MRRSNKHITHNDDDDETRFNAKDKMSPAWAGGGIPAGWVGDAVPVAAAAPVESAGDAGAGEPAAVPGTAAPGGSDLVGATAGGLRGLTAGVGRGAEPPVGVRAPPGLSVDGETVSNHTHTHRCGRVPDLQLGGCRFESPPWATLHQGLLSLPSLRGR